MEVLAILNQRAGMGSTTTVVNLGDAFARQGRRVMLLDLDPRACLAPRLGIFRPPRQGVDRALLDGVSLSRLTISTRELLELVPAGPGLEMVERLDGGIERGQLLQQVLAREVPQIDHLLIDCPPSAGLLAMNALFAADAVLVPFVAEHPPVADLARFAATLEKVEALRQRPLVQRMVMNRFVARRKSSCDCLRQVQRHFPNFLLKTRISEAGMLSECAEAGRTIFEYRPRSRAASEFLALAEELREDIFSLAQDRIGNVA